MSRGGAREGSGRKPKFLEHGQEADSVPVRLPKEISKDVYEKWVKEQLIEKAKKHKQN